jgi:hypothetical protein
LRSKGHVLGLLLEFSPENRALKSRDNPQMKSRDPVLRGIAGDALRAVAVDPAGERQQLKP